jgi:acetyltransferase-like isoleucine patch superfamily enzyme
MPKFAAFIMDAFGLIRKLIKPAHVKAKKALLSNGNLVIGKNSNLDNCRVFHAGTEPGFVNIRVGDDCLLEGNIVLYTSKSRVTIGDRTFIGKDTTLYCYDEIEVGNDIMFSWGITVIDTNAHSLRSSERKNDVVDWKRGAAFKDWSKVLSKKITIADNAWIGFNSIVLKGTTVGKGAVVAAGSVVTKDVAPFTIVGGNPAVFIKETD